VLHNLHAGGLAGELQQARTPIHTTSHPVSWPRTCQESNSQQRNSQQRFPSRALCSAQQPTDNNTSDEPLSNVSATHHLDQRAPACEVQVARWRNAGQQRPCNGVDDGNTLKFGCRGDRYVHQSRWKRAPVHCRKLPAERGRKLYVFLHESAE